MATRQEEHLYEDLDLGNPESTQRDPQSPERDVDVKDFVKDEKAALSAALIQSWATCSTKGLFMLSKEELLDPSGYGIEVQRDGKEYEQRLIANPELVKTLLQTHLKKALPEGKGIKITQMTHAIPDMLEQYRAHFDQIEAQAHPGKPHLFYQIRIYRKGERPENGIIDLLLWTGTNYMVGEIKLTSTIKEQTAFQLAFYREFLTQERELPVSPISFILHCRHNWIYDRRRHPEHKRRCIQNTELLLFDLTLKAQAFTNLRTEIDQTEAQPLPDAEEICKEAKLISACWECAYRDRCHQTYLAQAENPRLETSGLKPAELDVLHSFGITHCREALHRLEELSDIHEDHEDLKNALKHRLEKTIELGGYCEWKPPMNKAGWPVPPHEILFFSQKIIPIENPKEGEPDRKYIDQWSMGIAGAVCEQIPESKREKRAVIAFTAYEYERAHRLWRHPNNPYKKDKPIGVILENEVFRKVWFPHPCLTLEGLTSCLHGINEHGNWANYAKTEQYAKLLKSEDTGEKAKTRHSQLVKLYIALTNLYWRIYG